MNLIPLQRKKRELSQGRDTGVVDFLSLLADSVSDIRTELGKDITDTLETRKAIQTFLQSTVDDIRAIGNNVRNRSSAVPDEDL